MVGTNSISQFTLMGVSAGAFGVAFNCDAVAATVKAKDPNAGANSESVSFFCFFVKTINLNSDVRCIMDSNDFIPTNVGGEICDPLE